MFRRKFSGSDGNRSPDLEGNKKKRSSVPQVSGLNSVAISVERWQSGMLVRSRVDLKLERSTAKQKVISNCYLLNLGKLKVCAV